MPRYQFEAPAVVCFEVEAASEAEATEKAGQAHTVLLNADQPAPYPGNESPATDARFWTVGEEGLRLLGTD